MSCLAACLPCLSLLFCSWPVASKIPPTHPRTHILISGPALGHLDQMEPLPVLWKALWT